MPGTQTRWTKSEINKLVAMRKSGKYTLEDLGKQYGVCRERMRQILERGGQTGLVTEARHNLIKPLVVKDYMVNDMGLIALSRKYHLKGSVIRKMIGKNYSKYKYSTDFNYFKVIDSHTKAYLYGVFYAVAHVAKVSVDFQRNPDSRAVLDLITSEICDSPCHAYTVNGKAAIRKVVNGKAFAQLLLGRGFVAGRIGNDKSKFPAVPDEYVCSFLLGYWEMRGGVAKKKYPTQIAKDLHFYGGKALMQQVLEAMPETVRAGAHYYAPDGTRECGGLYWFMEKDIVSILKFLTQHRPALRLSKVVAISKYI